MTHRQFFWGLSNGAIMLAIAGFFWLGLAMSVLPRTRPFFLLLVLGLVCLLVGAMRVRRKAGQFRFSELALGDERQRRETRRIQRGLRWTVLAQSALIALGVYACIQARRQDLIWPWIGLIVSLHFLPLGRLFHVRAYYAAGVAGTVVSASALIGLVDSWLAFLGMGGVMWSATIYVLQNADNIVRHGIAAIERASAV